MGFSFIDLQQPFPTPKLLDGNSPSLDNENRSWEPNTSEDHPLMTTIRETITRYRLQSPAHFDVAIDVKQAFRLQEVTLTRQTRINVSFAYFIGPECYTCRPVFRRHPRKKDHVLTKKVDIFENGHFMSLTKFLNKNFPCFPEAVDNKQMQAWWNANGKVFNWTGLPTELKEQVIQYCVHQQLEDGDYKEWLSRRRGRYQPRSARSREFGIYEIVDKLTDWAALLGVSHQIRAITLRLCFVGSSDMMQGNGFSITASSRLDLDNVLRRLGRYYQMIESNSLPVNYETQNLANSYRQYPRAFPQLKQYATFRHGVRRISLEMDFISYMHFFKVTIGGFERYLHPESISYEVFDQLPHLSEIAIRLSRKPRRGWENRPHRGPRLFHDYSPCPRTLHRIIYERVVDVLTLFQHVEVEGFVDEDEEARFLELRKAAMKKPKWTTADYDELYAECGGGVDLEEIVQPGTSSTRTKEERVVSTAVEDGEDVFFPPKCRCVEKCLVVFNEREKYGGR